MAGDYSTLLDGLEDTTTTANATIMEELEGSGMGASSTSPHVTLDTVSPPSIDGGEVQVEEEERQSGGGGDGMDASHLEETEDDVVIYGTDYSAGEFTSSFLLSAVSEREKLILELRTKIIMKEM